MWWLQAELLVIDISASAIFSPELYQVAWMIGLCSSDSLPVIHHNCHHFNRIYLKISIRLLTYKYIISLIMPSSTWNIQRSNGLLFSENVPLLPLYDSELYLMLIFSPPPPPHTHSVLGCNSWRGKQTVSRMKDNILKALSWPACSCWSKWCKT